MATISMLWRFEDLACDWTENNEHSRHILGVHGFRSFAVSDKELLFITSPWQDAGPGLPTCSLFLGLPSSSLVPIYQSTS